MNTTALEPSVDVFQTSAQQAFYLRAQELGARPLFAALTLPVARPVEARALRTALETLGRRHEILRTAYRRLPGMKWPVQSLCDELPVALPGIQPSVAEALGRSREAMLEDSNRALVVAQVEGEAGQHFITLLTPASSFDEASLRVLSAELASLLRGETLADDEDALQYLDYSTWQEELREEDIGHQGAAFWRNLQQQYAVAHRLPFEKAGEVSLARHQAVLTDANWCTEVQRAAVETGVEAEQLALLLWTAFVARIGQQEKLLMGWQVDGRNEQTATTLGRFARRLPVAFEHRSQQTLAQAMAAFAASVEQSLSWLDCLNEFELSGEGAAPLRYGFVYQAAIESAIEVDDGNPEVLRLCVQGDQLQLSCLDGALPESMLAEWLEQFAEFSRQLLTSSELTLAQADLVNAAQRTRLIEGFNPNATEQALPCRFLQELFSEQARLHPQRIALSVNGQRLTYAELDARSNQVANTLRAQGVTPDEIVAVYGQRSLEMVIALLGTLKAGAAYLPLDPNYPIERLAFMLADTGARHVLACQPLPDALGREQSISLMPGAEVWSAAQTRPEPQGDSANLAYVIYTSGSTGKPKGVMISHANAVASTLARNAFYQQPLRAFLMLSSFSFDSSVAGVFWALGQGATLCLPDEDSYKDPARLAELIQREKVSHYLTLPSYHAQILEHLDHQALACVIVAGEACGNALVQRHREALPGVALVNEYGPTEGTVWCSAWELPLSDDDDSIPIGQPIAGMRIHVLGPDLQPVAVGVEGELYVGGVRRGHHEAQQLRAGRGFPGDDGGVLDARRAAHGRFDFAQLDAETADFHLVIDPAQILQHAIGAIARQVTGAVQALARRVREQVGDKTFGRQRGTLQVTPGNAGTANVEFTLDAHGHRLQVRAEHVNAHAGNRLADRDAVGVLAERQFPGRAPHGAFGGAVFVDQCHPRQCLAMSLHQGVAAGFAGNDDAGQGLLIEVFENLGVVGRQGQVVGNLFALDQCRQLRRILVAVFVRQAQRRALPQRPEHTGHRAIEGER